MLSSDSSNRSESCLAALARRMVTGQLTRSEAEGALRRLEGLRDDWERQVKRWTEHHEKADNIKKLQQVPSAPLVYTVEACCNMMGIATIRYSAPFAAYRCTELDTDCCSKTSSND